MHVRGTRSLGNFGSHTCFLCACVSCYRYRVTVSSSDFSRIWDIPVQSQTSESLLMDFSIEYLFFQMCHFSCSQCEAQWVFLQQPFKAEMEKGFPTGDRNRHCEASLYILSSAGHSCHPASQASNIVPPEASSKGFPWKGGEHKQTVEDLCFVLLFLAPLCHTLLIPFISDCRRTRVCVCQVYCRLAIGGSDWDILLVFRGLSLGKHKHIMTIQGLLVE